MVCYTTKKEPFQISPEDEPLIQQALSIRIMSTGYVELKMENGKFLLHRLIAKPTSNFVVDHKNGDKLDNRKENLRICTTAQNIRNSKKTKTRKCSSAYKGVGFHIETGKWRGSIFINYKRICLGLFNTEIEAAEAYDNAAAYYHLEFASFNFPNRIPTPNAYAPKQQYSTHKGISFDRTRNKWTACIRCGKNRWRERFNTEAEAIAAIQTKRIELGL